MFDAAKQLLAQNPQIEFIIPAINALRKQQINQLLDQAQLKAHVFDNSYGAGVGRLVMSAANIVVLASGTATLEAMLLKKPMVVVYKLHWLTYWIVRLLSKARYISLPNLLANKALVPELVQNQATANNIAQATQDWLNDTVKTTQVIHTFTELHQQLQADGSATAALAISRLIAR